MAESSSSNLAQQLDQLTELVQSPAWKTLMRPALLRFREAALTQLAEKATPNDELFRGIIKVTTLMVGLEVNREKILGSLVQLAQQGANHREVVDKLLQDAVS